MQKLNTKLVGASLVAMTLLAASPAVADTETELLRERIEQCERVINLGDVAVTKQAEVIDKLEHQNSQLTQALDYEIAKSAKAQAWYRDPSVVAPVTFVLGVVLGAYAIKGAK